MNARERRRATERGAGQTGTPQEPAGLAGASSGARPPRAATNAAVFESLSAPGISAAAQIENLGEAGDTTPPDTTGAIGPSEYIEFVNDEIVAYSRSALAQVIAPVNITTFVGDTHPKGSACDPQIKYDPLSERWFYVAIECGEPVEKNENALYLGFSKTKEPSDLSTGVGKGWCGYSYTPPEGAGILEDYPKLGLDTLHIIIGTNAFKISPESFPTSHIFAVEKPPSGTITTCPAAPSLATFGSAGTPLKTSLHKATTPEPATVAGGAVNGYVVASDQTLPFSGNGKNIMIWQVTGTGEETKLTPVADPTVAEFKLPPLVPQPASTDQLDPLDSRLTQAITAPDPSLANAEAIWTQHTVAGGGGTVVRWYELVPGKAEVRQQGTISDVGKFDFNGAIAPTSAGGAVINYDTASASSLVQIMAQSRVASAPAGTMNTPILLESSSQIDADFSCPSQPLGKFFEAESCRWGDYAGASVDPSNGSVVWGSNQVNGPIGPATINGHKAQWATWNFALSANDVAPTAAFSVSPNPALSGSPTEFRAGASSDIDGTIASYSWNFADGSAAGSGAVPTHVYGAPGTYTATLTVTDNGGKTSSVSQAVSVVAAPASSTPTPLPSEPAPKPKPSPNSGFSGHASFDSTTGAITVSLTVANSGIFRWLATFANGRFGVFAARANRCKAGQVRLKGKCRPAKVKFGKGSKAVAAAGPVTFTIKPTAAGRKALRVVAKHKKGLPVTLTITYQSALGGAAVTHTALLTVKLKR